MYVKYCSHCNGYTIKLKTKKCPVCGRSLEQRQGESTAQFGQRLETFAKSGAGQEEKLGKGQTEASTAKGSEGERAKRTSEQRESRQRETRTEKTETGNTKKGNASSAKKRTGSTTTQGGRQRHPGTQRGTAAAHTGSHRTVSGRICDYSNVSAEAGTYRRFWFQKLYQAIVYHQRTEDVLHRFRVHTADGRDIFVNMHGTISSGANFENNLNVTVSGSYRNGFLMADKASIEYENSRVPVRMQHCFQLFLPMTILFVILCMAGGVLASGFSVGGIQGSIQSLTAFCHDFIRVFLLSYLVFLGIYFFLIWPRRRWGYFYRRQNPFFTCFILAIIATLLLMNVAGLGDMAAKAANGAVLSLEDILSEILPLAATLLLTIWGIVMMIRAIL